jgi:hypothetical protein
MAERGGFGSCTSQSHPHLLDYTFPRMPRLPPLPGRIARYCPVESIRQRWQTSGCLCLPQMPSVALAGRLAPGPRSFSHVQAVFFDKPLIDCTGIFPLRNLSRQRRSMAHCLQASSSTG